MLAVITNSRDALMNAALTLQLSRLEAKLHQPVIRANAERLVELLHSEFEEIGRSGQNDLVPEKRIPCEVIQSKQEETK